MKDLRQVLGDAVARVLYGPVALRFRPEGDRRLVLERDPSGERLGFRANLPWWLLPRPKPVTMVLLDETHLFAGHPPGMGSGKDNALYHDPGGRQ